MTKYKQIFIINKDLAMGKGKIAVQVAHGTVLYMEYMVDFISGCTVQPELQRYLDWRGNNIKPIGTMPKIVLKASEIEMNRLSSNLSHYGIEYFEVHDLGKTQVEAGSFTCVCVEPLDIGRCDELFGHLKLL